MTEVLLEESNRSEMLGHRRRLYSGNEPRARTRNDQPRNGLSAQCFGPGRPCADHSLLLGQRPGGTLSRYSASQSNEASALQRFEGSRTDPQGNGLRQRNRGRHSNRRAAHSPGFATECQRTPHHDRIRELGVVDQEPQESDCIDVENDADVSNNAIDSAWHVTIGWGDPPYRHGSMVSAPA